MYFVLFYVVNNLEPDEVRPQTQGVQLLYQFRCLVYDDVVDAFGWPLVRYDWHVLFSGVVSVPRGKVSSSCHGHSLRI